MNNTDETKKELYLPAIVRKEVNDEHYYFVNEQYFPSVTKILGESMPMPYALRQWIGDVGNEKAEEKFESAGDLGTFVHDTCEALLKGEKIKLSEIRFKEKLLPDRVKKMLVGFVNWVALYQPEYKVGNIEFTVASRLGYAGTLDLFCTINGEPYIIDFKTSSGVYDSHKLQIIAYKNAYSEMTGIMPKVGILHLNPRCKAFWA